MDAKGEYHGLKRPPAMKRASQSGSGYPSELSVLQDINIDNINHIEDQWSHFGGSNETLPRPYTVLQIFLHV